MIEGTVFEDTTTGEAVIGAERIKALRAFTGNDDVKFNKLAAAMGRNVSLSLDEKEAKEFGLKDGK